MEAIDAMARAFAQMSISDSQSSSTANIGQPNPSLVVEFDALACRFLNRRTIGGSEKEKKRDFKASFGALPTAMARIWELLIEEDLLPYGCKKIHLLWCLYFMKTYPNERTEKATLNASVVTIRKWKWEFVFAIKDLVPRLVRLFNLFIDDLCHCLTTDVVPS